MSTEDVSTTFTTSLRSSTTHGASEDSSPVNSKKNPIKEEEEAEEENMVMCFCCNEAIYCDKETVYNLSKGKKEMTLCIGCFEDIWRELRSDGWECDDFSQQSEAEQIMNS